MLNLIIGELKQILESCGLITIKYNNIKFVIHTSSHGGNYIWSIFCLENSLFSNYFITMYVTRYNKYQKNMYVIGLGCQIQLKKPRKCGEIKRMLMEKFRK